MLTPQVGCLLAAGDAHAALQLLIRRDELTDAILVAAAIDVSLEKKIKNTRFFSIFVF